jgi:predicted nucleotidyltransferase
MIINEISGLDKKISDQIVKLILKYKIPEKIAIFGSRAKGEFKETSDIDIAIFGKDWTDKDINITRHILNEFIKTPLKIDVVNFYSINKDSLKQQILKNGKTLYES